MKFVETPIAGAYLLEIEPIVDERGFFARSFCLDALARLGLDGRILQQSISFNQMRGTLRGLHYQSHPNEEIKLVRVTRGRVYDVILDLRQESPSYFSWYAVELSEHNHRTLYIPKGVAHGFQTLEDKTEVFYQMTQPYVSGSSCGVRWNDPAFGIDWPLDCYSISVRDANYPLFNS